MNLKCKCKFKVKHRECLRDEERSDRPLCYLDDESIEEPSSEDKQLYKQIRRNEILMNLNVNRNRLFC